MVFRSAKFASRCSFGTQWGKQAKEGPTTRATHRTDSPQWSQRKVPAPNDDDPQRSSTPEKRDLRWAQGVELWGLCRSVPPSHGPFYLFPENLVVFGCLIRLVRQRMHPIAIGHSVSLLAAFPVVRASADPPHPCFYGEGGPKFWGVCVV